MYCTGEKLVLSLIRKSDLRFCEEVIAISTTIAVSLLGLFKLEKPATILRPNVKSIYCFILLPINPISLPSNICDFAKQEEQRKNTFL